MCKYIYICVIIGKYITNNKNDINSKFKKLKKKRQKI